MIYCLTDNASSTPLGVTYPVMGSSSLITLNASSTPLFATTTCPVGNSTTTIAVTNSPVDNPVLDLFLGLIMMYMVFAGVIWFFRKK